MPGKRKETMEIREMLRRFQQGQSNRSIARDLGVNRKTVERYRMQAVSQDRAQLLGQIAGGQHQ